MKKIVSVGEAMIEIGRSRAGPDCLERRFGGDTLNTAVYLARLLPAAAFKVGYATRLGDDWLSDWMVAGIAAEGIGCEAIGRAARRRPGLYLIETDASGERSFSFWRDTAPVRQLFDGESAPGVGCLADADLLYVTGITLAVLGARGRAALLGAMVARKAAGAEVAFDSNYRAALWDSPETARDWTRRAAAAATLFLPSLEDLQALFKTGAAEQACAACRDFTDAAIVLKTGGGPVHIDQDGDSEVVTLARDPRPLDTTGAGDAFNGGFIAARLRDRDFAESCRLGHAVAARVIVHYGAIVPREATQDIAAQLADAPAPHTS